MHSDAPEAVRGVNPKSIAVLLGGSDAGAPLAGGDHVFDAAAGMAALGGEYIPGVLTAKLLENRLSVIIEHYHPRALALDEIRRQYKHASLEREGVQFRDPNFPSPLEPTEVLVAIGGTGAFAQAPHALDALVDVPGVFTARGVASVKSPNCSRHGLSFR